MPAARRERNLNARELIEVHRAAGRRFTAGGLESFAREQGPPDAPPVVLLHGVPTSSFLYRKVIAILAEQGLRAVAFDLPGLGLASRPRSFDYRWTRLSRWIGEALDALGIERCHLVVHDIGGPLGCEWAARNPERVMSLTALNTMLDPTAFTPPWTMRPFRVRGLGEAWLWATPRPLFAALFTRQGIADRRAVTQAEVEAHHELLRSGDGGRAFLRIMRGFELTDEKRRLIWAGLGAREYPARIVWGERDPALGHDQLEIARRVLGVDPILVPAKHFLQEDHAPEVAHAIADLAAPLG